MSIDGRQAGSGTYEYNSPYKDRATWQSMYLREQYRLKYNRYYRKVVHIQPMRYVGYENNDATTLV